MNQDSNYCKDCAYFDFVSYPPTTSLGPFYDRWCSHPTVVKIEHIHGYISRPDPVDVRGYEMTCQLWQERIGFWRYWWRRLFA
jgi:hypothetical protein